MATLQASATTTVNATTSASANSILCSTGPGWQLWSGSVSIPYLGTADLLQNNSGYAWALGWYEFIFYQGYFAHRNRYFSLSRYGYQEVGGVTADATVSVYRSSGATDSISIMRAQNVGASVPGTIVMNVWIFPGINSGSVTSNILTRYT